MSLSRLPADDAFADVQRLLVQLSEFQSKYPQFEDELTMLCQPVNIGWLSWQQNNITKVIKNCEDVLRRRVAYEKEMRWVQRTQDAQMYALDKALPFDALCHIIAHLQHYDLESVVDVCTTFREVVYADSRFEFTPPQFLKRESTDMEIAIKQYRFFQEHGSKMRNLRLDMLKYSAFPLHRLCECLRMCIKLESVQLFGTPVEQQAILDTLAEAGAPVSKVTIADGGSWYTRVEAKDDNKDETENQALAEICVDFRNLPIEVVNCPPWMSDKYTSFSFTSSKASASLCKFEVAPSSLSVFASCSFLQLTSLALSYLDVDFVAVASSEVILFPCLESLRIERRICVRINNVFSPGTTLEPFGFHPSLTAAGASVAKHLPRLHTFTIKFLTVQSWARPYQKPHDPSLPAPVQPLYAHETLIFEQDCFVAIQQVPALVTHLRATLAILTLDNCYIPLIVSRHDDLLVSSLIATEWLRELSVFTREQDTRGIMGRLATEPPQYPSFEYPCSLAIDPLVLQKLVVVYTLPVPYLFIAGRSASVLPDDNAIIPPLLLHVHFPKMKDEWSSRELFRWMRYGVGDGGDTRNNGSRFSFGIDARMVAPNDVQVSTRGHFPSRGAEFLVKCEMHASDMIAKAFCEPNTPWLTDVAVVSQQFRHLHTLQLAFPHTGMGAVFQQPDRFLHLIDMPHLTDLDLQMELEQDDGLFGRTTSVAPTIRPVVTLDQLPSLRNLSTKWFHVHWKRNVSASLRSLTVIGGLCRSHVNETVPVTAFIATDHPSVVHDSSSSSSSSHSSQHIVLATQELPQPWMLYLQDIPELNYVKLDPLCIGDDAHVQSYFPTAKKRATESVVTAQDSWHLVVRRCAELATIVIEGERKLREYSVTIDETPKLTVLVLVFMHLVRLVTSEWPHIRMIVLAGLEEANVASSIPDLYTSLRSTLLSSCVSNMSDCSIHRMVVAPDFLMPQSATTSSIECPMSAFSSTELFRIEHVPKQSKWYFKQVDANGTITRQRHFVHWSLFPLLVHLSSLLKQCSIRPPHTRLTYRNSGSTLTIHSHLMARRTRYNAEGFERIADEPLSCSADERSDDPDD